MGASCLRLGWGLLTGALFSLAQPTPDISPTGGGSGGSCLADHCVQGGLAPVLTEAEPQVQGVSDVQERWPQAPCSLSMGAELSRGLCLCGCSPSPPCDGVPAENGTRAPRFSEVSCVSAAHQGTSSAVSPYGSKMAASCCDKGPLCIAGDTANDLLLGPVGSLPGVSRTPSLPVTTGFVPEMLCAFTWCPPGAIPARDPGNAANPPSCCFLETDVQTSLTLGFQVHVAPAVALCLLVDLGDGSVIEMSLQNISETTVTAYHQYRTEGVYKLRAVIDEFHGTRVELGPYYLEISSEAVSVFMNSSSVHQDEVLVFSVSHLKSTVVMHRFPSTSSYNISFISQTQVGDIQAWSSVTVWYKMQPVSVYTNGTVFAADTEVTFVAVTKETAPLEFAWHFGADPPIRTTSRSIRRRLRVPQWYHVTVTASSGASSVVSEPHLIRVQKRIVANRLVSAASALVNSSVAFECRINFGTDVTYLWSFGDGTVSPGSSSANHAYRREGEFTVEVLAFNNVSSAALRKQLFIVREPCQPPPVKNMGPGKVQVWRAQPLRLAVTFEAAVLCDISQGLSYNWSFVDSGGSPVPLPAAVNLHRQAVVLPSYTLEPGNYTAIAKVQIQGSVVHSNYCVGVEVRSRLPVGVISEGTHLFIPRAAAATVTLSGSQSYDPDHPGAVLRYHWTCAAASSPGQPCFEDSAQHQLDTRAPDIFFSARWLSNCCDQFLVTLTVSSSGRNSSETQVFLSTHPASAFRVTHISWISFKDIYINWNEELSLRAVCEDCGGMPNLSYSWRLFLVNATEKTRMEVPFCSAVGLLGASALRPIWEFSESNLLATQATRTTKADSSGTSMLSTRDPSPMTHSLPGLSITGTTSVEPMVSGQGVPAAGDPEALWELAEDGPLGSEPGFLGEGAPSTSPEERSWPSPASSPALNDFEAYYSDIEEAVPSQGRQPGNNTSPPESGPSASDGDNLVGPFLSRGRAEPILMVDWPKALVSQTVFQGYTSSGTMEPAVTIKPYSLSSGETYVLQATVASKHSILGKAQLYVTVNQAPQDMACQVQPHRGLEAHTVFGVFCMSGKPDFRYEFSYRIGNSSKRTLYHGRDTQYYFALPAGEPSDKYKVMISTEITDGKGSKVQPCTVAVIVLPRFHGNACPDKDLYNSSLKNLSTLQLMGSYTEIKNYVTMIATILSRLAKESGSALCSQWSQMQNAFISSVCKLDFAYQEEIVNSVLMLRGLINFPSKLSFLSAVHILKFARTLLAGSQLSRRFVVDKGLGLELVLLISGVWEASEQEGLNNADYLREGGMKVISDVLLGCLSSSQEPQLDLRAGQMAFRVLLHHDLRSSIQTLGSARVHLPGDLAGQSPAQEGVQSSCYVSQLMFFKKNSFPGGQAPEQVGDVLGLSLFSCSSRRPIPRGWLATPVTVEFGEDDGQDNNENKTTYILFRDKVNFHQFVGLSRNPQESLQIQIELSKPVRRAFPIMLLSLDFNFFKSHTEKGSETGSEKTLSLSLSCLLFSICQSPALLAGLVRFSEKPTPSDFFVKQTYFWNDQTVQMYIPAIPQKGASVGYLSLLDADYDRRPPNQYFAEAVSYTVLFQWVRCLLWDKREWKPASFSPQPGTSPGKVNCSYDRLATFSVLRRRLNASFEVSDISGLQSHPQNLLPGIFTMVFMILYGLLAIKSRYVDHHNTKKSGYIFLHEDTPAGHQLYAVVIDTGFRMPARLTSKVYIILCGEDGLSETQELYCPEKPLFERNSRHTFILSTSKPLGLLQKVHLWHDSRGPSPSWFISRVMVKDLCSGQGWFFPAQCWLAADRCDGRVARELTCLRRGLGFRKLFYAKFTEYLEDFHVWLSGYSRPSGSGYLRTQRLTVSFCLLCVHACLAALVTVGVQEQLPTDGPLDITLESFRLALLCAFLASPGAQLLALLFRLSKDAKSPPRAEAGEPLRGRQTEAPWASASGFEGLMPQRSRAHLSWSSSAAWAICVLASLACALGTGFLGYRFVPAQCVRWLHLLTLSIICCVFVIQPLMICCVALGFAWRRKDDPQFFAESLCEATRNLDLELEEHSRTHVLFSRNCCLPDGVGDVNEVLAARERQRRLRWARPPSKAQLRETREKVRRARRRQAALRDISVYILTMLLLLLVIYGKHSPDEYSLNQAIRKEFVRPEARAALRALRASRWIDRSTRTVSVHFTLYNPPTRLFSSVTLRAELLPTGALAPTSLVESFKIFHGESAPWYHLVLPELFFLVLNLIHLCFQLYKMVEKGVLKYAKKPKNWLELSAIGVALAYYAASGQLTALARDAADQFQKGLCQVLMDLSPMALWNQRVRWLRGILSFLWTLKGIYLLGSLSTTAFCPFMMRHFLSYVLVPALVGALLLAARSHLLQFSLFLWMLPSGNFADPFPGLLPHFPGRSQKDSLGSFPGSDQPALTRYCTALVLLTTMLCFGMLRISLMTFFQKRKSFRPKSLLRFKDITADAWRKALTFLGLKMSKSEETEVAMDQRYYLDEFASLLDELLMKINSLSDSLNLPLLEERPSNTMVAQGAPAYQDSAPVGGMF